MTLNVYNTLSREKEEFKPINAGEVRMYVCGPTVYDKAHVGHAMSSIVFDIIRRYLEHKGFRVRHVMNYTDVDDKVINRANEIGQDALALAEKYVREYQQHLIDLNILPATSYPRVSHEIEPIQEMVAGLIDNGYAYEVEGDVFFRVDRDDDYGKLSRRKVEDMQAGARLEIDQRKENPADFALWKAAKPGEPSWDSPWGPGRPGWHIECSAMSYQYLGEQIDIHGGGSDLVFPHHENEIAQTESYTGEPFARYWLHNGMLQFTGEKMSKSIGNVISVEEFLADHEADVLRMIILNGSYRSPLVFNEEVITQAEASLERLRAALRPAEPTAEGDEGAVASLQQQIKATSDQFEQSMDDDFNTPGALSGLFELVRAINVARDAGTTQEELEEGQDALLTLASVLGLRLEHTRSEAQSAGPFIDVLLEVRDRLRQDKQFELADMIRDRLAAEGIEIEDTKSGASWRRSRS